MPVTVLKIGRSLEQALVLESSVVQSVPGSKCLHLQIHVDDPRRFVHRHLLGNHHVVVGGHVGEDAALVLDVLGIQACSAR